MERDGKAILLTAPGSTAIAVVRLVGPGVAEFLRQHFSRPAAAGRCVHGELRDGEKIIDDPVVMLDPAGRFADVNLHGGPWVVRAALELAGRCGFEVIDRPGVPLPDEATEGATTLAREVEAYLPLARTELALRVLLAQEEAWGPEARVPPPASASHAAEDSRAPGGPAGILADWSLYWLLHLPRVAIVGAPNVGKSTLANQLFAQERSITADLPGTTRDWVGEIANIDGLAVMLVDTPGVRQTADEIERDAIGRSAGQIERADAIVLVLDGSVSLNEQQPLVERFPQAIRVINKSDRSAAWDWAMVGADTVRTVGTTGTGIDQLRQSICRRFGCADIEIHRPRWWTTRQRALLEAAAR